MTKHLRQIIEYHRNPVHYVWSKIKAVSAVPDPTDRDAQEYMHNSSLFDPRARQTRQNAIKTAKELIAKGKHPEDAAVAAANKHKVLLPAVKNGLKGF